MARMSKLTAPISIPQVRSSVKGEVIGPDDAEYDEAAGASSAGSTAVRPSSSRSPTPDDVRHASSRSRARPASELAVRSGGHSAAGHSVVDGGIVLDVSAMKALEIDVDGRTAWAETGLTAGEYSRGAVAEHGLATGFGDTGSVGIGGITLGGGVGYLVRKHGLTIDDLLAAEIVTADGELLRRRRRPPPRPVLGDPRRRRQLRGRDPVPVPAARR